MGLLMEDLHNPTVGSGPTSGPASNGVAKEEMTLMELIAEKDRVESEMSALGAVLDSVCLPVFHDTYRSDAFKHGVNMNTSLTTFDGYPRDDIDIAQSTIPPLSEMKASGADRWQFAQQEHG